VLCALSPCCFDGGVIAMSHSIQDNEKLVLNPLTAEEERVIVHKGTEAPHTGKYDRFTQKGVYLCRRCNAALYRSDDKFDAECGWPSFDDEIPGAVRRVPDADGRRTEIVCARCEAHLGHVFVGERLTPKDTRHCVNSISLKFQPVAAITSAADTAVFASGCFWGSEYVFSRAPGVIAHRVGYAGGHTEHPTYHDVCSGQTGHAEAVEVVFDPHRTTYEALARLFFETHDPTQVNRQGPDVGEQYRSVIFYKNDAQHQAAQRLIGELGKKGIKAATRLEPAGKFWPAEEYHQKYYRKNGGEPYCHIPRKVF
jgi:peptide methionine sulfoxide reductase msrA/msrB